MRAADDADFVDTGGVGGTLAGNALSLAAMRATLGQVLTDDVWEHTIPLAARFADGVRAAVGDRGWNVTQLGCARRVPLPGRTGAQRHRSARGVRSRPRALPAPARAQPRRAITPFHNMALMAPTTTAEDVDRHSAVFAEALQVL